MLRGREPCTRDSQRRDDSWKCLLSQIVLNICYQLFFCCLLQLQSEVREIEAGYKGFTGRKTFFNVQVENKGAKERSHSFFTRPDQTEDYSDNVSRSHKNHPETSLAIAFGNSTKT